jgi:hypothetical protein
MGFAQAAAREGLLQVYAQPVYNAQRAAAQAVAA